MRVIRKNNILDENIMLRGDNKHLRIQLKEAKKIIGTKDKIIAELKKKIRKYENENTPSSMIPVYIKPVMKSPNRPPVGTNPRGKPKGSNGATRKIPKKVDRKVKVKFKRKELRLLKKEYNEKIEIRTVKLYSWESPKPKITVTEFIVQRAYVKKKMIAQATHPELPKRGIFGNRLRSWIISLKNGFAGSYERIAEHIEDLTGETFSQQAIKDAVHRTGEELEPDYRELESELRESEVAEGDTSSWKINGINYVLWLLCTINIVFISIEKSKARKVIIRILGNVFEGVFTSDCAPEFQKFARFFQKCWSHLLRATHTLAELNPKEDIALLHEWLTNLFNKMSEFLKKDPPPNLREKMFNYFDGIFEDVVNYNWKSKDARSIVKNRLIKYRDDWLTAILIPGVTLTNNNAERHIRSAIPTRKLLGGHRTNEGAKYYAITQSLRLTWKIRGLSPYHTMVDKFREINSEIDFL